MFASRLGYRGNGGFLKRLMLLIREPVSTAAARFQPPSPPTVPIRVEGGETTTSSSEDVGVSQV